jgi:hypothetical protein
MRFPLRQAVRRAECSMPNPTCSPRVWLSNHCRILTTTMLACRLPANAVQTEIGMWQLTLSVIFSCSCS